MNFEKKVKNQSGTVSRIKDTLLNFIVPLISLIATLGLVFFVALPYKAKIPELNTELTDAQTLRAQLDTKVAVLRKLENLQDVVEEDGDLLEQALPEEGMVPELLTQVDVIARESGLSVSKLSYSISDLPPAPASDEEGVQEASYNAIIVNLGAGGGFAQLETFLKNLENSARIVNVNNLRFSVDNSEENEAVFLATFILSAPYLYVESEAVTDAAVTVDISSPDFQKVMEKTKELKYYDVLAGIEFLTVEESDIDEVTDVGEEETPPEDGISVPVEEVLNPTEETTPTEETSPTPTPTETAPTAQ